MVRLRLTTTSLMCAVGRPARLSLERLTRDSLAGRAASSAVAVDRAQINAYFKIYVAIPFQSIL